jgi:hypothetical protein
MMELTEQLVCGTYRFQIHHTAITITIHFLFFDTFPCAIFLTRWLLLFFTICRNGIKYRRFVDSTIWRGYD